ncbi:phosphatidylinositol-specific phospholipase C domain-containing protein [Streptomyces xiaopingdaonensis]|uniref:phosphatidylinositol-specific phospholipase C domain-containing protein n=1 Tax=Streptomyces xiaopingdaonensis TaxID=1565415 RepID=UPI0002FCCCA8|nr:phosphatidylinositol-specific phospholipase C domain-containing protein [Streptomyces xiaopingdaonensis]
MTSESPRPRHLTLGRGLLALVLAVLTGFLAAPADAAPPEAAESLADTTAVGVHNAYEQDKYPYFTEALESGAALLELDVWTNALGKGWRVSHSNPLGNVNNCADGRSSGTRNSDLAGCVADMAAWHAAHPDHPPVLVKLEMKDGFYAKAGRGPAELDALLDDGLGDAVLSPGDVAEGHEDLDTAVRAGAWPQRAELAGKFLFELIPGTVEESNPADDLWTDEEYATHLRDLAAAGDLDSATAFPAVHGAEAGDPRAARYAADLRGWFVVFDGDASAYADGTIDTAWYRENGYLLVMTDAHLVAPEIDAVSPEPREALDRVTELASQHASFVSSDWYPLPDVLSTVVPRG